MYHSLEWIKDLKWKRGDCGKKQHTNGFGALCVRLTKRKKLGDDDNNNQFHTWTALFVDNFRAEY